MKNNFYKFLIKNSLQKYAWAQIDLTNNGYKNCDENIRNLEFENVTHKHQKGYKNCDKNIRNLELENLTQKHQKEY